MILEVDKGILYLKEGGGYYKLVAAIKAIDVNNKKGYNEEVY